MTIKLLSLVAIGHFVDNGDGSSTVTLYNDRDELQTDLEESGSAYSVEDIEEGDDPYETGTISEVVIDLEYDETTGKTRLARSISLASDG